MSKSPFYRTGKSKSPLFQKKNPITGKTQQEQNTANETENIKQKTFKKEFDNYMTAREGKKNWENADPKNYFSEAGYPRQNELDSLKKVYRDKKLSPLHQNNSFSSLKPKHGETYGDFHDRASGGATNHWGGPETNKKLLNQQYSDSSSTFVRNPKNLNLNPAKLKEARNSKKNNAKLNLPKPKPNENQSDYMARTMGNPGFVRSDKILNKQ